MEKHFATYNQSLALKELGFNEPCLYSYYQDGTIGSVLRQNGGSNLVNWNESNTLCSRPLKSQVFEWARKEHQIEVTVACFYSKRLGISYEERQYHCHIVRDGVTTKGPKFKTYEEAESACIDKLIEIVKNNLDK